MQFVLVWDLHKTWGMKALTQKPITVMCTLTLLANLVACSPAADAPDLTRTPNMGKADTTGAVGSCRSDRSYSDDFCGDNCPPTLSELVSYIGRAICSGSTGSTLQGNCGVAAWDLSRDQQASYRGDQSTYAASSIKFIMVAAALYNGVDPATIRNLAQSIFQHSSNTAPAQVLDALNRKTGRTDAGDRVNRFMHDVVGMSPKSLFTRWCPAGHTCHKAQTTCTLSDCGAVMPYLTANDTLKFLKYVATQSFAGRDSLWQWSAARDQDLGLFGMRSCGLQNVTVHHKVGSLWFGDEDGLLYNDIGIIEVPGRSPLLIAMLDGRFAVQGQQGRAAYALYRFVRSRVVDFSGGGVSTPPSTPPSTPTLPSTATARRLCATVHNIDTCSNSYQQTLLECDSQRGIYRFRRCANRCVNGGYMNDDYCR